MITKKTSGKALYWVMGIIALFGIFAMSFVGKYNTIVTQDEEVQKTWGEVENQYQRRLDLIPNLVGTVKGAAAHEKDTLEAVIQARASATKMEVDLKSAEEFAAFQDRQTGLASSLSRLMMITENYPNLQVNQNFLGLQTQLEGTENRITVARKRYNEVAKDYNVLIRRFPNNMVAGFFGFEKYETFTAKEDAEVAPTVEFK